MVDTPTGETATPGASQTPVQPPTAPAANVDVAEVERLRKEADQARMRTNQLEKEKAERDKADEEAKQQKLEEDNKYKELYEQEKAKREGLETEAEAKERQKTVNETKQKVLSEYSEEVRAVAEEAGMDLTDADDSTVTTFKDKLEKISKRIGSKVSPNNPNPSLNKEELSQDDLRKALRNDNKFHELVTERFPTIKAMTKQK